MTVEEITWNNETKELFVSLFNECERHMEAVKDFDNHSSVFIYLMSMEAGNHLGLLSLIFDKIKKERKL